MIFDCFKKVGKLYTKNLILHLSFQLVLTQYLRNVCVFSLYLGNTWGDHVTGWVRVWEGVKADLGWCRVSQGVTLK